MFQINLKKLRERNGWSQVELAHRLGVSQSTVGMWEAGRNKPTYATLLKIAQEFKVSVDGLIGGVWNGSLAFSGNPPILASQAVVYATEAPVPTTQLITMSDSSMAPEILCGDLLLVISSSLIVSGDLLAFYQESSLFVRKAFVLQDTIVAQAADPSLAPICFLEASPSAAGVTILGKVTELSRKFR